MAQYLTPSKIYLLVLSALYCEGFVRPDATIPVLSLVVPQQLPPQPTRPQNAGKSPSRRSQVVDLQTIRDVLTQHQAARGDGSLWDAYWHIICQISNTDALFDFFGNLKQLFAARQGDAGTTLLVLSPVSLLGSFVRRSQLEWAKLTMQEVVGLWLNFRRDVTRFNSQFSSHKDELDLVDAKYGGRLTHALDRFELLRINDADGPESLSSPHDIERMLSTMLRNLHEYQARVPDNEMHWTKLPLPSVEAASAAFQTRCYDAILSGDFTTSFEYLHRYYDYDMRLRSGQSFYQFALLGTALLHSGLNCYEEAIKALNETMSIARENKDTVCLVLALHYLYHIRSIVRKSRIPRGQAMSQLDSKGLGFLKSKAIEHRVFPVATNTMLKEARLILSSGNAPSQALERIFESATLNTNHGMWDFMTAQQLQSSSIFACVGSQSLALSYCSLVVDTGIKGVSSLNYLQARFRASYAALLSGDAKTLQKQLSYLSAYKEKNILTQQYAQVFRAIVKLKSCLLSHNLDTAEVILNTLSDMPVPDNELRFQVSLLRLDYYSQRDDFDQAYHLIEALFDENAADSLFNSKSILYDAAQALQLLIAKARLFAKFGNAQKGFTLTLRATLVALEMKNLPCLWEATATLSRVLVSVGQPDEALQLLKSITCQATETFDLELLAFVYSATADCYVALSGKSRGHPSEYPHALSEAARWVGKALQCYTELNHALGKREMTAKSAVVLSLLGDANGAAANASALQKLREEVKA